MKWAVAFLRTDAGRTTRDGEPGILGVQPTATLGFSNSTRLDI